MLKELREALKAEVELVKPIRQKIHTTRDWARYEAWNEKRRRSETRRHLHLAACYLRGTPYRKCEAESLSPSAQQIVDLLAEYGCTEDTERSVASWLDVAPVPVVKPPKIRRLYVVVRADLPPGAQAVQAAHAMREFAADYPEVEKEWHETSNTVAMLSVPDEAALVALVETLRQPWGGHLDSTFVSEFHEPDLGGALTAICVEPAGGQRLRHLPLALRASAA